MKETIHGDRALESMGDAAGEGGGWERCHFPKSVNRLGQNLKARRDKSCEKFMNVLLYPACDCMVCHDITSSSPVMMMHKL
jgi:hypothetical protein